MWKRLAPRQPPEVLRVPLQQLCLTTKAALAASTPGGVKEPKVYLLHHHRHYIYLLSSPIITFILYIGGGSYINPMAMAS